MESSSFHNGYQYEKSEKKTNINKRYAFNDSLEGPKFPSYVNDSQIPRGVVIEIFFN